MPTLVESIKQAVIEGHADVTARLTQQALAGGMLTGMPGALPSCHWGG